MATQPLAKATDAQPRNGCCDAPTSDADTLRSWSFEVPTALGQQTIGAAGSMVLNINGVMGPAMVALPFIYQSSGWALPTALLFVAMCSASFASTMLCEAMQRIPGNHDFRKRYEFATTVKHYWGSRSYVLAQVLLSLCLQSLNIASIIIAAQVMDEFLVSYTGATHGIEFYPELGWISAVDPSWPGHTHVVSLGFVLCFLICLPFGYMNLDENMWFQWLSFVLLAVTTAEFIYSYTELPWDVDRVPSFNPGVRNNAHVLGVVIFSYACVLMVPSWVNEKKPAVSVNQTMWASCFTGFILKLLMGLFAAYAYGNLTPADANILTVMNNDHRLGTHSQRMMTRVFVYAFNFGTIIPGIPIYSILVRYNLLTGKVCSPFWAFMAAVAAPWGISAFLYLGHGFLKVMNWTSILLQGFVNFVVPVALYLSAIHRHPKVEPAAQGAHFTYKSVFPADDLNKLSASASSAASASPPAPPPHIVTAVPAWMEAHGLTPAMVAWAVITVNTVLVLATLLVDLNFLLFYHIDLVD